MPNAIAQETEAVCRGLRELCIRSNIAIPAELDGSGGADAGFALTRSASDAAAEDAASDTSCAVPPADAPHCEAFSTEAEPAPVPAAVAAPQVGLRREGVPSRPGTRSPCSAGAVQGEPCLLRERIGESINGLCALDWREQSALSMPAQCRGLSNGCRDLQTPPAVAPAEANAAADAEAGNGAASEAAPSAGESTAAAAAAAAAATAAAALGQLAAALSTQYQEQAEVPWVTVLALRVALCGWGEPAAGARSIRFEGVLV
jgi:hypothetical protein